MAGPAASSTQGGRSTILSFFARQGGIITPVLMLTARDEVRERVEALDSGADDYLTKPFSIEELLARVRARLRRVYRRDRLHRHRLR